MEKYPLIRKIYLYLFALLGLVLIIIGFVQLINLGLKVYIFKKAEQAQVYYEMPPSVPYKVAPGATATTEQIKVDEQLSKQWEVDYKNWQDREKKIDRLGSSRQQTASWALALIIVGLPLYLYHWLIIKRETKLRNEDLIA